MGVPHRPRAASGTCGGLKTVSPTVTFRWPTEARADGAALSPAVRTSAAVAMAVATR